jgi:hypothetical protein
VPKKEDVTGGMRKLHNEERHNFYSLSSILYVIKNQMRSTKYVARFGRLTIFIRRYGMILNKS